MPFIMDYLKILLEVVLLVLAFQTLGAVARPTVHYLDMTNDPGTAVNLHDECLGVSTKIVPTRVRGSVDSKTGQYCLTAVYSPGVKPPPETPKSSEVTVTVVSSAATVAEQPDAVVISETPEKTEVLEEKGLDSVTNDENNRESSAVVVIQHDGNTDEIGAGHAAVKCNEESSNAADTSAVTAPNKGVEILVPVVKDAAHSETVSESLPKPTYEEKPESVTPKSETTEVKSPAEITDPDSAPVADVVLPVHTEQSRSASDVVAASVDDKRESVANIQPSSAPPPTMVVNADEPKSVVAPITTAAVDTQSSQKSEIRRNNESAAKESTTTTAADAADIPVTIDETHSVAPLEASPAPAVHPEVVVTIAKTYEELYSPGTEPV